MTTEVHEPSAPENAAPRKRAEASLPQGGIRGALPGLIVLVVILAFAGGVWFSGAVRERLGFQGGKSSAAVGAVEGEKKQLWTCGMHPQVIQDHPGECPICHMELTPLKTEAAGSGDATMERKVLYWKDPEADYTATEPGKSPAGRELVPVYNDEMSGGPAVTVDPVIVQNMGVRVATAERGQLERRVRLVGYVTEREPDHRDINLRVSGWIEKLHADTDGMLIKKGEPLFDFYSPQITVAIDELIAGRRAVERAKTSADEQGRRVAETLFEAAARKLELWGLTPQQVEELSKAEKAPRTVSILAPIGGHLTAKMVYEGAAVESGTLALRLANRDRMWVEARAFEQQLPLVKAGQPARATVVAQPGRTYEGKVAFIHPHLDVTTRTALVRVEVPNEDHALREGMYASVEIEAPKGEESLLIPREAVLVTGDRQVVFVSEGSGRFSPRKVTTGLQGTNGLIQVLDGIAPGEAVVTSGQFLLDSESRLKEAIQKHLSGGLASHQGHAAPPKAAVASAQGTKGASATPATQSAEVLRVAHSDEVIAAYLELSRTLGARSDDVAPVSIDGLADAAGRAATHSAGKGKALAEAIVAAAKTMSGKPRAEQRTLFGPLSSTVVELARRTGVSPSVGPEVVVAYCPMALGNKGGFWLQAGSELANPYYAKIMKKCGSVEEKIVVRTD